MNDQANCPKPTNPDSLRFIEMLEKNHGGHLFTEPMTEVDQYDLAWTPFMEAGPAFIRHGYAQIDGRTESGTFYVYYDGQGLFIARTYDGPYQAGKPNPKLKIRFWRFGCKHEMQRTRNLGRCYNEFTCTKCGHKETVDSSD